VLGTRRNPPVAGLTLDHELGGPRGVTVGKPICERAIAENAKGRPEKRHPTGVFWVLGRKKPPLVHRGRGNRSSAGNLLLQRLTPEEGKHIGSVMAFEGGSFQRVVRRETCDPISSTAVLRGELSGSISREGDSCCREIASHVGGGGILAREGLSPKGLRRSKVIHAGKKNGKTWAENFRQRGSEAPRCGSVDEGRSAGGTLLAGQGENAEGRLSSKFRRTHRGRASSPADANQSEKK